MSGVVVEKIIEMFIIMIGGFTAFKTRLVDENTTKKMSDLLLMLISPLLIFQSYQIDFNMKYFLGLLWTFLASVATFAFMIVLSGVLFRGKDERIPVEKVGAIYSNCGFIEFRW